MPALEHMSVSLLRFSIFYSTLIFFPLLLAVASPLYGFSRDTTIAVFTDAPIDEAHNTIEIPMLMPDVTQLYGQVILYYSIKCPTLGCDPWDRVSAITVKKEDEKGKELYEIARIITPAGRGWQWAIDVTDYRFLLRDSVTIINHINTAVGGGKGFLASMAIRFIPGSPMLEAYKVENLWAGLPEYGNPERPIEDFLRPIGMKADSAMEFATLKIRTTGHGEGNTDDAATFSQKWHRVTVGDTTFKHVLWRNDCDANPASPQLGNWEAPRAGYCPGAEVLSWNNDISSLIKPGGLYTLDYDVEPYENKCRPGYTPCPCRDCTYHDVMHLKPYYWIETQIVYYRIPIIDKAVSRANNLFGVQQAAGQKGVFTITSNLAKPTSLIIRVLDALGSERYYQAVRSDASSRFTIDMSSTPGVYLLMIDTGDIVFKDRLDAR